ncbi:zinc-binding dehydrogenase [Pseudogracilibacillus sp. SO30301A]|uniref:zinc-binding dehydrogenase n=1 Tax=Pseudogracilibacillus sp. SO30301A TaxID=3098291 RepID=UPI00300DD5A0
MGISNKTMKGIVLHEHGGIEQLSYEEDIELKPLKADEVRVQVKYCGLNHLDIWLRKGGTGDRLSLPQIPGSDVVGIIHEVGNKVNHVDVGDAVVLYPGKGCGSCSSCIKGRETLCQHFEVLGYNNDGGYAEYVTIQGKRAVKITNDELRSWSGVPIAYVTAWNALVTKGKMTANDTVFIWGASGGLGYAALSIAKAIGANVIGIVSSKEKKEFLQEKGFTDVSFIVRDEDIVKQVREITNKVGADIVLDHVGRKTFNDSLRMLARGGRLAFCGITTGPFTEVDLRLIFGKQLTITGSWMGDLQDFHEVVNLIEKKNAFPHIHQEFLLIEAGKAQASLEAGDHIGKIILKVDTNDK